MGLSDALVEPAYFDLHRVQLCNNCLTGKARVARKTLNAAFRHNRSQLMQSFTPLRCHQPEFGKAQQPKLSMPPMDPAEVTDAIVYFCSHAGRHLTGVALPLDGGLTLK